MVRAVPIKCEPCIESHFGKWNSRYIQEPNDNKPSVHNLKDKSLFVLILLFGFQFFAPTLPKRILCEAGVSARRERVEWPR